MESREAALKRAREIGYPESSVVSHDGEAYIAPLYVTSEAGKQQYWALRHQGMAKDEASAITIAAEKKRKGESRADMNIEIRADGTAHISGYVNVTEKKSRPVITPRGKVIEEVEQRAFEKAIERADNVPMTKDHSYFDSIVLAETRSGSLELYEDNIGLHYDAKVSDPQTIQEIRSGKVRGLSFGMKNVVDEIENRADGIPIRHIKALDLDHITLSVNSVPFYAATSIEVRAGADVDIEMRAFENTPKITEHKTPPDNSAYRNRINAIKA